MSSQAFFWVNFGLGVILLCVFWVARKKRALVGKTRSAIFVYNGHNFDAYEVLGIGRNISKEDLARLSAQVENSSTSDREFKKAALRALV